MNDAVVASSGWRSAPPASRITMVAFGIYLGVQFAVLAVNAVTRYRFSDPAAMAVSDALRPIYDYALMATPNQLFIPLFVAETPLWMSLVLIGVLNIAVAFVVYVLLIRRRWRPLVLMPSYVVLSIVLWIAAMRFA